MARTKAVISQRDFSLMEVRDDFLEADDTDVRRASLKGALNMRALATRTIQERPGTFWKRTLTSSARDLIEVRPTDGVTYGIALSDDALEVIDSAARVVHTEASVPWSDASALWVETFRTTTLIGARDVGIYALEYDEDDASWSFAEFEFQSAPGGGLAQPYWAYEKGITITPSAATGSITVTASSSVWQTGHVGLRIRYNFREIEITSRVSSTVINGTVVDELPPSFKITVEDSSEFQVDEAVVGADTNYQGRIVSISGNDLYCSTLEFFEGPDVGEELSGAGGSSKITAVASTSVQSSEVWDEPLMSDLRGWPGSAASASGRLTFVDFPKAPDVVAMSSSRGIDDFETGADDDDAIVRSVGDNAPRFRHVVNQSDILLLSDRGLYYIPTRESGLITPSTFNPVRFDDRGANGIRPVLVDDGVAFVETSGESVLVALLDGNVYLNWSVQALTQHHYHLINTPTKLCGPSHSSPDPEKYLFVVNSDGSLAAVSWESNLGSERVGFAPWETDGDFISVSPIFGGYWPIVDREVDGSTVRFLETFDNDAALDCAVVGSTTADVLETNGADLDVNGNTLVVGAPVLSHLATETVHYYADGFYAGTYTVNSDGSVTNPPGNEQDSQIGLHFDAVAELWPAEIIDSPRAGMLKARVSRLALSVQSTGRFQVRCNNTTRTLGGYSFGDDLSAAPPVQTRIYRIPVFGNRDHPEIEITRHVPGRFRLLAAHQEVQV